MRNDVPKTLCPLPWIHIETSPLGEVRACCQAKDLVRKEDNTPYNLKDNTLEEAFNSQYMNDLRQAFLNGEKPGICANCWNEEDGGRRSKRMNSIKIFADDYYKRSYRNNELDLKFLDLKLGTVCNLKCRICGTWSSSKFAKEDIDLEMQNGLDKKETIAYRHLKMGNWPRESEGFWENLKTILPKIEYFEFTGGEPMMIQEHFDLLKYSVDKGYAPNQRIHYNTNSTQLPVDALKDIWPHFKSVEFAFSIDDMYERFEYQRYGSNWKESNHNIKTIRDEAHKHRNWTIQLCLTISVFNINNLVQTTEWAKDIGFDSHYYNIVHTPTFWNIQSLSKKVKDHLANKLIDPRHWLKFPKSYITELVHVSQYLRQNNTWNENLHEARLKEINRRDLYRGQLLSEVDPETWNLINEKD